LFLTFLHLSPLRTYHASSSISLLEDDGCVEATRRSFMDASLVAEVLSLNYTHSMDGGGTRIRTGDEGFADLCLTTWLCRHEKAEDGTRTRDPHLGKVVFYH
jgi:hypothetical protein